jgi:hypothetical protein
MFEICNHSLWQIVTVLCLPIGLDSSPTRPNRTARFIFINLHSLFMTEFDDSFVYPSTFVPNGQDPHQVLTEEQVRNWKEQGYCLVNGLIEPDFLNDILTIAHNFYPLEKFKSGNYKADFGANECQEMVFPSLKAENQKLNQVCLYERILDAVVQLLGVQSTADIRLTQSECWCKLGQENVNVEDPGNNEDQRIHIDGYNHYLTFPADWYQPEAVGLIIYYDDSEKTGGETAIVAREGKEDPAYHETEADDTFPLLLTPGGRGDFHWINNKYLAEKFFEETNPEVHSFRQELYRREKKAKFSKGTVLFYRLDVWHRGRPIKAGQIRRTHNLLYKRAGHDWINNWNAGPAKEMYQRQQFVEKLIATSTMKQRMVLGFPHPEHNYWTPYTLEACKRRYGYLPGGYQHFEEIEAAVAKKFGAAK